MLPPARLPPVDVAWTFDCAHPLCTIENLLIYACFRRSTFRRRRARTRCAARRGAAAVLRAHFPTPRGQPGEISLPPKGFSDAFNKSPCCASAVISKSWSIGLAMGRKTRIRTRMALSGSHHSRFGGAHRPLHPGQLPPRPLWCVQCPFFARSRTVQLCVS